MELSKLCATLGLKGKNIISVYGAGGKTTLLYLLAAELAAAGQKVVLTTTTKMYQPTSHPLILQEDLGTALAAIKETLTTQNTVMVAREMLPGHKVQGIPALWVEEIWRRGLASTILVEGDGAAGKPVKGYASHEPVLPNASHLAIPVLGLDALGAMVREENVHRREEFSRLTGVFPGEALEARSFVTCLQEMVRLGKTQCPNAQIIPIFNKADLSPREAILDLIRALAGFTGIDRVLFTALQDALNPVQFIFHSRDGRLTPRVSIVMLAAGSSRRMGHKKLFLPYKGGTILEASLRGALDSGAREIVLVAPPEDAQEMANMLVNKNIRIVVSHQNREGQATSLQAGLAAVTPSTQGVIFALADQPLVKGEVYDSLIQAYGSQLKPVVCPVYQGVRGNPVLFDRRLWPSLMNLTGDQGGRQIIRSLEPADVALVKTTCPGILSDIDTPADYRELMEQEDSCP